MRLRMLALITSFILIPSAQAYTVVWFDAVPISGYPSSGSGPGNTLGLVCGWSQSPCMWQVSMKAALGEGGVLTWSLDLRTAPGNGVSILNPQIVPSPFTDATSPGTPGTGLSLLRTAHGQTFSPPRPQTVTLLTFTLRRTFLPGDFSTASIFGGPSANETWGPWVNYTTGDYEVVQFGANPRAPGIEGTVGALPLITVGEVPEPASLSHLALGAAVCLLRRRGRRSKRGE